MMIIDKPIEEHPFKPFIPENATILIIGSFPGREQTRGKQNSDEWFYGAKRNYFWKIISSVYQIPIKTKEDKQNLFNKFGIGITDIFQKNQRINETNYDTDLHVLENNEKEIKSILQNHKINIILFTSIFVQEYFLKYFPEVKNYSCLLSPSPSANRPLAKSIEFLNFKQENPNSNTIDFRINQYKQLLNV